MRLFSFFFTTEIVSALKKSGKNIMKSYKQDCQSGKQCICSHKCSKQLSGVTAGKLFLLVGSAAPTPFSQNFILRLRTVPALFSPTLRWDFLKTWKLALRQNLKLPPALDKIFSKALAGTSVCVIIIEN